VSIDREVARKDFLMRIKNYESYYFQVSRDECSENVGCVIRPLFCSRLS